MNPPAGRGVLVDPDYPRLKAHLIRATGLAYYADKDADLADRLARRLAAAGAADCAAYLARLGAAGGDAELDALIADLTIGETFFFRHKEVFDALRAVVVPDVLARNRSARRLRVWSAGCSVGAEAYSVSILLKREFAAALAGWDVSVVGTDINRDFLARARTARFEDWAMRGTDDGFRRACFTRVGGAWELKPEFREGVSFQYHNLVTHPFPSVLHDLLDFDLILCRNVTIYFSADIVETLIDRFHRGLADGGWLAVGHAEPNVLLYRAFRTVNTGAAVLYQKAAAPPPTPTPPAWAWLTPAPPSPPQAPGGRPAPPPPRPPAAADERGAAPAPDLAAVRALADRGAWADAADACGRLAATARLDPAVHFLHGLVLEQLGRHAEAEAALRRTLYLDRSHPLAHYYLALLLQRQGRLADAGRSFRNAVGLLAAADPARVFDDGDGITAGELVGLIRTHLEVLNR